MPSEQATAAAENIASWLRLEAHQFPSDGNVAEWAAIIDAAFAPVVAERDALLREADGLFEMGVWYGDYKARSLSGKAEKWEQQAQEVRDRITAMIGEQA